KPPTCRAALPSPALKPNGEKAATADRDLAPSRHASYTGYETCGVLFSMEYLERSSMYGRTMAPGSPTPDGGRKNSASTMPKTVLVAPMPNARQRTAAAVNPGVRRSERRANVRSNIPAPGSGGSRRLSKAGTGRGPLREDRVP